MNKREKQSYWIAAVVMMICYAITKNMNFAIWSGVAIILYRISAMEEFLNNK